MLVCDSGMLRRLMWVILGCPKQLTRVVALWDHHYQSNPPRAQQYCHHPCATGTVWGQTAVAKVQKTCFPFKNNGNSEKQWTSVQSVLFAERPIWCWSVCTGSIRSMAVWTQNDLGNQIWRPWASLDHTLATKKVTRASLDHTLAAQGPGKKYEVSEKK